MNVQLPLVLSDIMGETGQKILRAIVAGERDPLKLAQLRHPSCKSPEDEIAKALTGTWQPEHLFALKQSLEIVDFFTRQLADCDAELERQFAAVKPRWEVPVESPSLPKAKPGSRSKNQPAILPGLNSTASRASIWSPWRGSVPPSRKRSSAKWAPT